MKKALVTGANRGIGLEFCRQLLESQSHYEIIATCRQPASADALHSLAKTHEGRIKVLPLDLSLPDSEFFGHPAQELQGAGPFHVVINNAGMLLQEKGFETFDFEGFRKSFEVNTIGPFRVLKALGKKGLAQGCKIANLSSLMGSIADNGSGGFYSYRSSKAALNMLNRSFASDEKDFISVVLHPGWVLTDMGGPNALVTPHDSVAGMLKIIEELTPNQSGKFLEYTGKELPW